MKIKASNIVHFVAIWIIAGLILNMVLPDVVKTHQGVWPSIIIGFLISGGIALYRYRRTVKKDIQDKQGFEQLPHPQQIKQFLKKLMQPLYILAGLGENFVFFALFGYLLLPAHEKVTDFWICILYGGLLALALTFGKMALLKRWQQKK